MAKLFSLSNVKKVLGRSSSAASTPDELSLIEGSLIAGTALKGSLERDYTALDVLKEDNKVRMNAIVLGEARHYKKRDAVAHEYIVASFTHIPSSQKHYIRIDFVGGHPEENERTETVASKSSSVSSSYPSVWVIGTGEGKPFFSTVTSWPLDTPIRKETFSTTTNFCTYADLSILACAVADQVIGHPGGRLSRPCFWFSHGVMQVLSSNYEIVPGKAAGSSVQNETPQGTAGTVAPQNSDVNVILAEFNSGQWKYVAVPSLIESLATTSSTNFQTARNAFHSLVETADGRLRQLKESISA